MDGLYALMFAAGVAAFAYTKLGRRAGYGNTQYVVALVAGTFVAAFIFLFVLFAFVIHIH